MGSYGLRGGWTSFLTVMFLLGAGLVVGEPAELGLEIDLVLGSVDDEAEFIFGAIASVVEDSQGNIYVADASQMSVLKFKPDGEFPLPAAGSLRGPGLRSHRGTLAVNLVWWRRCGESTRDARDQGRKRELPQPVELDWSRCLAGWRDPDLGIPGY